MGMLRWIAAAAVLFLIGLTVPVIYIETSCRAKPVRSVFVSRILDERFLRPESNSYLSYPRWQIAYTHDHFAKTLESDDESSFNYLRAVIDFWSSFCAANRLAMRHGADDAGVRGALHLTGIGFTTHMAFKALYEETLGQIFANFRGQEKTAQDRYVADTAADYAAFLKDGNWSDYDFEQAAQGLWAQPLTGSAREWERRLAIGLEWQVKAVLASIRSALFGRSDAAASQIPRLSVGSGLSAEEFAAVNGVQVAQTGPELSIIELPNDERFTSTILEILSKGGAFLEVAGNDDILLSFVRSDNVGGSLPFNYPAVWRAPRAGYDDERILFSAKVTDLAPIVGLFADDGFQLERIYNY